MLEPDDVVGHKLWDFIEDLETRHLYREVFKRARVGKSPESIPFRCDSPTERRYHELRIEPLPGGQLQITSKILRIEPREHVQLLDREGPKSADTVTVCSMCKKIKVAPEQWDEIEKGLTLLRLFEADRMPRLSHGVCPPCAEAVLLELEEA